MNPIEMLLAKDYDNLLEHMAHVGNKTSTSVLEIIGYIARDVFSKARTNVCCSGQRNNKPASHDRLFNHHIHLFPFTFITSQHPSPYAAFSDISGEWWQMMDYVKIATQGEQQCRE